MLGSPLDQTNGGRALAQPMQSCLARKLKERKERDVLVFIRCLGINT
jgi:hypothetical protein